ncbi:odorant receptor 2a-like [Condylostylus longicornis]|uniref:odorant receptor 2a-like n=1 Tax=Condylostylus longicornis TaxID=2530218 RepID=UPI00244DC536|nr:odorant receptor 2a-like [Condylostylus longicornis]
MDGIENVDSVKWMWKICYFLGIDPPSELNKQKKFIYYFEHILLLICALYFIISLIMHTIIVADESAVFENMAVIATCSTCSSFALYYLKIEDSNSEATSLILMYIVILQQIFFTSFFADLLKGESEKLTNALFSCSWVNKDKRFRKSLIIFMQRSQKTFDINAGWIPVTLNTFAKVLNFSYSSFLLLKEVEN